MASFDEELRSFLSCASSVAGSSSPSFSNLRPAALAGLRLMRAYPAAAREAVLAFFADICDAATDVHFRLREKLDSNGEAPTSATSILERQLAEAIVILNALQEALAEFVGANADAWAPIIVTWALGVLGELSSKYNSWVSSFSSVGGIHEALPIWLECHSANVLIEATTTCIQSLLGSQVNSASTETKPNVFSDQTESCISALLDTSVKHSPNFDWVVAHIGGCFPETVIDRVLSVGLKEFCQHAETQIKKDGSLSIAKIPKINSVVEILGHLASSHTSEINACLQKMADESIRAAPKVRTEQQTGTIPYFLQLSSLSEMISMALSESIYTHVTPELAEQIRSLVAMWEAAYFPESDSLQSLVVYLIVHRESNGKDVLRLLFEYGSEKNKHGVTKEVRSGCRTILELVLAELLTLVHHTSKHKRDDIALLRAVGQDYELFLQAYMFSSDAFQKRSCICLLGLLALYMGQKVAVRAIRYCLIQGKCDEDLGVMLEYIRDVELWLPRAVGVAVSQSLMYQGPESPQILKNLSACLEYQSLPLEEQKIKIVSQFATGILLHQEELLPKLLKGPLVLHVLRIFSFVPITADQLHSVAFVHTAASSFVHAVFMLLKKALNEGQHQNNRDGLIQNITDCVKALLEISSQTTGLNVVLRHLMEGAINSPFAELFGGKFKSATPKLPPKQNGNLLEENLKLGSLPAQLFGTSTVFHSGVLGSGKRKPPLECTMSQEAIDFNQFCFITVLFRICHAQRRDRSKEACKQLSLLLVEMISPDVMYNGLPWPEEEFTKVTIERDLKISKMFDDHPLLWKILMGVAESRPALCYCSVLLRALFAVQMNLWASSVSARAGENQKQLQTTSRVLELMSVGQFLPAPLNAVSDVLHVMHAFHVHCVLVDVWNFMRDNVPSPVAFASNSTGAVLREFEPYKNYKQYCERLRLILIRHIDKIPEEFKAFFVDVWVAQEHNLEIAMEY